MSFINEIEAWPEQRIRALIDNATPDDVDRALAHEERSPQDLAALLSPHALPRMEAMAREARRLTRWHFGRTMTLYTPLYLSNICKADCVYCGYAVRSGNRERRISLTEEQTHAECKALAERGFTNLLLLTGETRTATPFEYIKQGVAIARQYFPSVSVEVYTLEENEYAELCDVGLEGVTIYMETYHRPTYDDVHLKGQKKDYLYRLNASERAGRAGTRRLGVGALLGLFDCRIDAFWTALHARYLQKTCWQSAVSVSFPRLRHVPPRYTIAQTVGDREFVQLILALRLFLPEAGFTLSTRETAAFRDNLIPLGITMMSAGSSTRPGGYTTYGEETLEQFEIEDSRTPEEVVAAIRRAGYEPVWKDFDHAFHTA
ncbi:MAG: 2-iminoacetate synthase ThiH [FCB group bacterium]|nr:2-iminoacetate synthase ThiH [FCB group bacterium]